MPTVRLLIKGDVQGVFYRASACEKAEEYDVTGWIKNTGDGHVEAIVSGSQNQVDEFISWCRKGPARAQVTEIIISKETDQHFTKFSIFR